MDAELPDFEPTTGHRHGCPGHVDLDNVRDKFAEMGSMRATVQGSCDCAAELYCIAAQAEEAIRLKLENLGPMDGRHVLVVRGHVSLGSESFGEHLLKELCRMATERGLTGAAAPHVPLVVVLPDEGQSIELLGEDEMRRNGWYRSPAFPVKPLPPGPYS